jgi:hypothetical protein
LPEHNASFWLHLHVNNLKDIIIVISDRWFGPYERTLATSIGSFSNNLGSIFSILFPVLYFRNIEESQIPSRMENMNFVAAIVGSITLIFGLIFIKNKPKTPPSFSSQDVKLGFLKSIKMMASSGKNIMNLLSISVCN